MLKTIDDFPSKKNLAFYFVIFHEAVGTFPKFEVFSKISEIAESIREEPRPVLVEFKTFRMRGHEEASGTKYVPQELMDEWQLKDPLLNFEDFEILPPGRKSF